MERKLPADGFGGHLIRRESIVQNCSLGPTERRNNQFFQVPAILELESAFSGQRIILGSNRTWLTSFKGWISRWVESLVLGPTAIWARPLRTISASPSSN